MFQNISDLELVSRTKELVREERRILAQVLGCLEEIERRRIHLARGFLSMFEFCRTELGYTENEAFSRIAAMRLSREVPEVVQAVEAGRLSLTNLAQAQSFFRKSEKPVPVEEKRKVLQELEGMSTRECKKKFIPEGMQRKTFEVDDELLADLKRVRELWGNQDLSDTELLRKMAKLVLSRIDPGLKKSVGAPKVNVAVGEDLDPARSGDEAAMEEVLTSRDGDARVARDTGCGEARGLAKGPGALHVPARGAKMLVAIRAAVGSYRAVLARRGAYGGQCPAAVPGAPSDEIARGGLTS